MTLQLNYYIVVPIHNPLSLGNDGQYLGSFELQRLTFDIDP
jgi:hypothetical protein